MRLLRCVWLLLACLAGAARAEDLLAVYTQARAADPLLAGADAQRGVQREVTVQARAALLPQWQLSANEQRRSDDGQRSLALGSSITQVLLDLGRLRSWDAARTEDSAQDALVRAAEQDLCARVARAYFGVLSAQAALATALANEDNFAAQARLAAKRFEAGLSAQVDVDQARAYHELSRAGSVQSQQALADAREALAQITGRAPGPLRSLAPDLPALPPDPADPQAWVAQALQAHPLLQAQAYSLQAGEQRVDAARAAHWPTLGLALDNNSRQSGNPPTQLALRLSVPLFAGGATESAVRQAAYQRDGQRQALEAARRAQAREALAQYQAVVAGVALMQSTQAAVAAADRALVSTRAGQALGTRSMTDLLLAIQTMSSAQAAHDQARHGYMLAQLLLQQAVGHLGEAELAAANHWLQGDS